MTDDEKQQLYRDARFTKQYDGIWQNVGKCVFCDLKDKYVFFEENGMVMTVQLFAYIDGHFMIIPRRHVSSMKELTPSEWETVRKFAYMAKKIIKDVHGIKGMQFVEKEGSMAQSTVTNHLHFHCIPFDAPDLSVWNYRKLKHTPIQNANLYKQQAKKLQKIALKFEAKYHRRPRLGVDCDVIIFNKQQQILFEERPHWAQIGAGHMSMPGGAIENLNQSLEQELAREVFEETGLTLDPSRFELVASRIAHLTRRQVLDTAEAYDFTDRFLWNTYVYRTAVAKTSLAAGDDAESLLWVPVAEVASHPRISPAVKAAIAQVRP